MTDEKPPVAELLQKAGDGDFLRPVAEAVLPLLMEADVGGVIGCRPARTHGRAPDTYRNGSLDRALDDTRLGRLQPRTPALRADPPHLPPFMEPRKTPEKALGAAIQGQPGLGPRFTGSAASRPGGWTTRRVDDPAGGRPGPGHGAGWDQQVPGQQAV